MRWLVEVTSLATTEKESLRLDAETWQKALQFARSKRGDTGPMSGFSIELLDDGCRAVDPTSRMRYEVRRDSEQGTSVAPPAVASPSLPPRSVHPPPAHPQSAAPRPSPQVQGHSRKSALGTRTMMMGSSSPVASDTRGTTPPQPGPTAPAPIAPVAIAPVAPAQPAAARAVAAPVAVAAAPVATAAPHVPMAPSVSVAPTVTTVEPAVAFAPSTLRADVAANVPSQIVFKREQEASDAMPLTYREYIYGVPPGTSEAAAETLLMTQLEFVRASLERAAAGKLVNLAVVDAPFEGKPKAAPLATLMWKDWRGVPMVAFPRRPGYAPAAAAVAAAPFIQQGPFPASPAVAPPQMPVLAPVSFTPPPPPAVAPVPFAPAPALAHAPAPVAAFAPAGPAFVANPAPAPAFAAPRMASTPPPPPRTDGPVVRVRGEDLVADLFEAMHDLHFLRDAVEGGDFCLMLAMEKLPSQAGIVHVYDINRREFLVTNTRGTAALPLLLLRHPEDEPMLAAAMKARRALVVPDAAGSEAATIERYVTIGGAHSLIVAPMMQSGRFLGAIELVNPVDGQPFTEPEGNAVMYIADQLAEFVGARGIVTDSERIAARRG